MSLQWTLIAGFLYFEIAVVLLLVLPVASPRKWNAFFKSKFLQGLQRQASVYFFIVLAILFLFLLDAIREIRKYSNPGDYYVNYACINFCVIRLFHNSYKIKRDLTKCQYDIDILRKNGKSFDRLIQRKFSCTVSH